MSEELGRSPASEGAPSWKRFQHALSAHLRQMRGVHCEPAQIIPTRGLRSALDLTTRVVLDSGDCVLVEDPTLQGVGETFGAAGGRVFYHAMENLGGELIRASFPPPRLIFVSPTFGFPLGRQMPEACRSALLEMASQSEAIIFEADVYWELSNAAKKIRSIQGTDSNGRVIYFGSMNETLGPHIRVSYLVVPLSLVDAFTQMARMAGYGPDDFMLSALATFLDEGQYALHLKSIRSAYAERIGLAVEACRSFFNGVSIAEPCGGFHISLLFPHNIDEDACCAAAARHGLLVTPLSTFYRQTARTEGLILGLGTVPDRSIETMFRRLADAVAPTIAQGRDFALAS